MATIGIGYGDGLPIGASGIGRGGVTVHIGDVPCPVVGRVSMDLSILDVTHLPPADVSPGTKVELLGLHQGVDDLGRQAGTIGYEILTNLGRRYVRHYVGGGREPS